MCDVYNGWTNKQSWSVALWLDNDYGMYNHVLSMVDEIKDEAESQRPHYWTVEEYTQFTLADQLKELVEESNPLADSADLYSDLMGHALGAVDWGEVASHYLEEE